MKPLGYGDTPEILPFLYRGTVEHISGFLSLFFLIPFWRSEWINAMRGGAIYRKTEGLGMGRIELCRPQAQWSMTQ